MTRVLMNVSLLAYQQEMKATLRQVLQQNFITGVRQVGQVALPLMRKNLLPPPCIICIGLEAYEGQDDVFIGVVAYHDFGIHAMNITILDDQGNLIEKGEVDPYPDDPEVWSYFPMARVPIGTSVIVQVTAMDCMGGFGMQMQRKTMGEEEL
jgi:hypothetical protein